MVDLRAAFTAAGARDVRTYIQSGNLVLNADAEVAASLAAAVAKRLERDFDLRTPVVLRTAEELANVARGNPFLARGESEDTAHVVFLADLPDAAAVSALDPKRSRGDELRVIGRDIYLSCPNGFGKTKLTNAYFDSKLKTVSTVRNWRTVLALLELATS